MQQFVESDFVALLAQLTSKHRTECSSLLNLLNAQIECIEFYNHMTFYNHHLTGTATALIAAKKNINLRTQELRASR